MFGDISDLFQVHTSMDVSKRLNWLNIDGNVFTISPRESGQSPIPAVPVRDLHSSSPLRHHGIDHWFQIPHFH